MKAGICIDGINSLLENFDSGSKKDRNLKIVKHYLGLDGNGGASMEVAGEPHGLTRESVRQILKKYKEHVQSSKISFQSIKEVIGILTKLAPVSAVSAASKLFDSGLIAKDFKIEAILLVAQFFDIPTGELYAVKEKSFRSQEFTTFIVTLETKDLPKSIYSQTLRETSHNGAASVKHISDNNKEGKRNHASLIKDVVSSIPGLVWLDDDNNWFYVADQSKNRVLSRLNRIFSVYSKSPLKAASEGIRRSINKHNDEISRRLPLHVLAAICTSEGLHLENDLLHKTHSFSHEIPTSDAEKRIIASYELKIIEAIAVHGKDTIQEVELENIIVKEPADKWPYSMALNYSPLIVRVKRGTYKTTGTY